jgi:hypothetical protein
VFPLTVIFQHSVLSAIFVCKCESQSGHRSLSQSAFSPEPSTPLISLTTISKSSGIGVDRFGHSLPKLELASQEYSESKSNYENNIFINLIDSNLKHHQDMSTICIFE